MLTHLLSPDLLASCHHKLPLLHYFVPLAADMSHARRKGPQVLDLLPKDYLAAGEACDLGDQELVGVEGAALSCAVREHPLVAVGF